MDECLEKDVDVLVVRGTGVVSVDGGNIIENVCEVQRQLTGDICLILVKNGRIFKVEALVWHIEGEG